MQARCVRRVAKQALIRVSFLRAGARALALGARQLFGLRHDEVGRVRVPPPSFSECPRGKRGAAARPEGA